MNVAEGRQRFLSCSQVNERESTMHAAFRIEQAMASARMAYDKLVLVVGSVGAGKTSAIRLVAERAGTAVVNLNLRLAESLVDHPSSEQHGIAVRCLQSMVQEGSGPLLLDNTGMLFAPQLHLNAAKVLRDLARSRLVIASWLGEVSNGKLIHARPGHSEWQSIAPEQVTVVTL